MAAHAHLKNELTEDEKSHQLLPKNVELKEVSGQTLKRIGELLESLNKTHHDIESSIAEEQQNQNTHKTSVASLRAEIIDVFDRYDEAYEAFQREWRMEANMGNFYLQYQYTLPVFSDKALSLK